MLTFGVLLSLTDRLSQPLKQVSANIETIAQRGRRLAQVGTGLIGLGAGAQQAHRTLKGMLDGPVMAAEQFESAMAGVRAVTDGITQESFAALRAQALELGSSTSYSASQAAEGMAFLAKAGFDANAQIAAMPSMLDLAKAGAVDLGRAADIASNILSGFGLEASEMTRVADVMVATFTTANTDIPMLGDTMKYIAPIAKAAGVSLEEAAAMAGLLGNAGIQGSMAGTALRSMLQRLAAPANAGAIMLEQLGIVTIDSAGNMRNLVDLLEEVTEATAHLGTGQQLEAIGDIFGVEAAAGAAELVAQGGSIAQYVERLSQMQGRAAQVARDMGDNMRGARVAYQSAVEGMQIALGDLLLPFLTAAYRGVTSVVQAISRWVRENPGIARFAMAALLAATAVVGVLAPVLTVAGGIAIMAGAVLTAIAKLAAWRAAHVASAAAAGVHAGALAVLMTRLRALPALIAAKLSAMKAAVVLAWTRSLFVAGVGLSVLRARLLGLPALLAAKARAVWAATLAMGAWTRANLLSLGGLKSLALALTARLVGGFKAAALAARALSLALLTSPIGWVVTAFVTAALLIRKYWRPITGFFRGVWRGLSEGLAPIREAFSDAFAPIAPLLQPVLEALGALWRWVSDLLKPVDDVGGASEALGRRFGRALAGILEWPAKIIAAFLSLPGQMLEAGRAIAQGIASGIIEGWRDIKTAIGDTAQGIKDSITGFFKIRSPSRLMADLGGMIAGGLAQGIRQGEPGVLRRIGGLSARIAAAPLAAGAVAFSGAAAAAPQSSSTVGYASYASNSPTFNINVTVHGQADGQDIANRVRREVEDLLRERSAREQLAHRSRMFD